MSAQLQKILRTGGVLVVLVGLPIFAWYFLNKGAQLRYRVMTELKPKSEVLDFIIAIEKDSIFSKEQLRIAKSLIAFIRHSETGQVAEKNINRIYTQSSKDFQPRMIVFEVDSSFPDSVIMKPKSAIANQEFVKVYQISENLFRSQFHSAFHLPDSLVKSNIAILVDTQLMIRNYYQLDDQAQLRNLVLHYPVFLSLKK